MKLYFLKKSTFEILWYIDLCTYLVKDYDIYCGTKCFDIDRIYALGLTMFQWAPPRSEEHTSESSHSGESRMPSSA